MPHTFLQLIEYMDIDIERKILKSGIMDAFTPKCPISTDALFCGRANEAQSIVRGLYIPGGMSFYMGIEELERLH